MSNLELMNSEIYSVFECDLEGMEIKFLAGFEELGEAKNYTEYLATCDRHAWVYGHEKPPFEFLEDGAWDID